MVGGALGMAPQSEFSRFFLENQAERRKSGLLFPLKVPTLFFVLHSRLKTKRSLRFEVDRLTDKMTTVTLWFMCAEG